MTADRAAWLNARRQLVTASDAPAILGLSEFVGPFAVWAEKCHGIERPQTIPMRVGVALEPLIVDLYAERTGRGVENLGAHAIQRHPEHAWLGATLDRRITGSEQRPAPAPGPGVLEAKWVGMWMRDRWDGEPPIAPMVQCQVQIACAQVQWGAIVGLLGDELLEVDVLPDADFIAAATPVLAEFHRRVVERDAPPADPTPGTGAAVRRMWPKDNGKTIALDGYDNLALADRLEALRDQIRALETEKDRVENELRCRIGDASYAALIDGSWVSALTQKRGNTEYRVLKRKRARLRRRSA